MKTPKPEKIVVWVGLFAGHVFGPFWVDYKMNSQVYHDLLVQKVWPAVRSKAVRQQPAIQQKII